MTQYERMENGLIYDPADSEIMSEQLIYQNKLWELNQLNAAMVHILNFLSGLTGAAFIFISDQEYTQISILRLLTTVTYTSVTK